MNRLRVRSQYQIGARMKLESVHGAPTSCLSFSCFRVSVCWSDWKLNECCCRCPLPLWAGGKTQGDDGAPAFQAVMGEMDCAGSGVSSLIAALIPQSLHFFFLSCTLSAKFLHLLQSRLSPISQCHRKLGGFAPIKLGWEPFCMWTSVLQQSISAQIWLIIV